MMEYTSCRVYRVLLHAYPRAHREGFGEEMCILFRDLAREARESGGVFRMARFWVRMLVDLAASAPAEHLDCLEVAMRWKMVIGLGLILFALGNIVYDALEAKAAMGTLAILVTTAAGAAGTALLARRSSA